MASIEAVESASGRRYRVIYRKPNGQQTSKRGFTTKRAAELWTAENTLRVFHDTYVSPTSGRQPLGPLIEEWLTHTARLSRSTVANRASTAKTWVIPEWSTWRVGDITRDAVRKWVRRLIDDEVSATTIEKAHGLLRGVLAEAVEQRLVVTNAAANIKLPRPRSTANQYLNHEEVVELASEINPHYELLITVLAYTGLRFGEAAALRVRDISFSRGRFNVELNLTEVGGVLEEGPVKTHEHRSVPFPASLAEPLAALVRGRAADDRVFTTTRGNELRLNTWRNRYFYPAIDRVNEQREAVHLEAGDDGVAQTFPRITPHDLRHTAASLAVSVGANVKAVQRMLGHKKASMTLDTYTDLFDNDLDMVSFSLDAVIQANAAAKNATP